MSESTKVSPADLIRPEIRALEAYTLDRRDSRFKLDQNESPWDFPRRLKVEATRRLLELRWSEYPDFHGQSLRQQLSELHDWPADGSLIGNGSGELLAIVLAAVAAPGTEVLSIEPSFSLYQSLVPRSGARLRSVSCAEAFELPMEELLHRVAEDPRRPVLLCSPNNPTGGAVTPEVIDELLQRLEGPLLLDNAYAEFCRYDYRPLLRRHRHLVIFRTLSKAWSLGGMRLGYLLADPELVGELIKVKLPYNTGHAAAAIGAVVLENSELARRRTAIVVERRSQWVAMLRCSGLEVFESEGNFVLVRSPRIAEIREGLATRGVLIRDVSNAPLLGNCARITVGTGAALRATRRGLREILGNGGGG